MTGGRARTHQQCDLVLLLTCPTKRTTPERAGALPCLLDGFLAKTRLHLVTNTIEDRYCSAQLKQSRTANPLVSDLRK